MLARFIIWLATKCLTHSQIIALFTDTAFKAGNSSSIQQVFLRAKNDGSIGFNAFALRMLAKTFSHSELGFIHAVTEIKRTSGVASEHQLTLLLDELSEAAQETNKLKAMKRLKTILAANTLTLCHVDADLESIAHALFLNGSFSSAAVSQFLKEI